MRVIYIILLAMAQPRQDYLDFLALVNPNNVDLRTALWSHFFPDNTNTRNPVIFEYKVGTNQVLDFYHLYFVLDISIDVGFIIAVF